VIPSVAGLITQGPIESNRDLIYKEAQFYIISVAVLMIVFALAVTYNPVTGGGSAILGEMNRLLALLPLVIYGIYIFIQYQDTMDYEPEVAAEHIRPLSSGDCCLQVWL